MNTVGPYHNRQETYSYFSLPFCPGPKKDISHYHETLSEALQGVELVFSGLDIDFKGMLLLQYSCFCMMIALYCCYGSRVYTVGWFWSVLKKTVITFSVSIFDEWV